MTDPQHCSPVTAERERMATRLDEHAIRYANDYGYNVATDLKRAAEMLRAPAQRAPGVVEISCEVDLLDDIEVDADGKCKWTDVANAQTHIRAVLHRFLPSPVASTDSGAPDTVTIPIDKLRSWTCPMDHRCQVGACLDSDTCHCLVLDISALAFTRPDGGGDK